MRGTGDEPWEHSYEFTGTKLQEFPLPSTLPVAYGRILDSLAQTASSHLPAAVLSSESTEADSTQPAPAVPVPTRQALDAARHQWEATRALMIAWQEELDWHCYRLYGLVDEDLTFADPEASDLPPLQLGQRAIRDRVGAADGGGAGVV